jgi:hypothetical protein
MPRFYFDVRRDGLVIADQEGEDFPDTAAAKREAGIAAVHLAKELLSGPRGVLIVEVRREGGQAVVRAKASLEVDDV